MTDFQEAFSLIDDAKLHIEELNQNKSTWIDKSREAVHNGNVMNFYFCIIKKTNDNFFNKDWVGAIIMCNTIMSEEGQCWIYISIKDADGNEIHIEKHIPIENSLEYYNLAKEFVRDIEFVNVDWIQNLNKWLKGDIISSKDE